MINHIILNFYLFLSYNFFLKFPLFVNKEVYPSSIVLIQREEE